MIDNISFQEAVDRIQQMISKRIPAIVLTPNVDHIVKVQKNNYFSKIYQHADLTVADGVPLIWAARFLGTPLKKKISGSDLFIRLCDVASKKGYRLFFLGGRPGAADLAAKNLRQQFTGIKINGIYSPPMGFEYDPKEQVKIIELIKKSSPDILFVGLGAPKQEKWIYENKVKYQVPVSIGIGVSFEFVAGLVKRAPKWMQKNGLEWFWRTLIEPKRLWRRYLSDMIFFYLIWQQKYYSKKK